ncbi:MAG TPA: SusD/RagB family nutrient-binding outer membrane lipoprotein [Cyclobacteriaceae bacterium]|nr:SusD/RagB family nutrient-binding outer membrane lipoprotein [Cyclobacteriaceae bacterium]
MKLKNISKVSAVLLLVFALGGCADFLDVNKSPNSPEDVPLNTLLPSALVSAGFANANELNRFGATVSDYLYGAGGSPANYDTYVLTGGDFGNQWTGEIWNGGLIQCRQIIEKGTETGANNYVGVAKIVQAYMWAMTTDIWGDIPYSQALQGDVGVTRPELDSQEDIYKGNASKGIVGLFDQIREGLAALDQPTILTMGADDVVYGGNLANWKKAGNTLMLRLAMTISAKDPAYATTVINEVITKNDFISTNAQNFSVKFGTAVGSQSPTYSYMFVTTFQNELIVSSRYLNLLQNGTPAVTTDDDPRLPLFLKKGSASTTYVTFENGFRGTLPATNTFTKWGDAVLGANGAGPVKLVTNAGRAFMLAEAIVTLGVTVPGQTAQSLYYEGIKASLAEAGVATADQNTYAGATLATATAVATLSGTTSEMQNQIITQKYIAMTGNGLEAWNDIRRTGFPAFTQVEHANAAGEDGKRPLRARYPDADIARNPNLGAAVKKTNQPVWWDAN